METSWEPEYARQLAKLHAAYAERYSAQDAEPFAHAATFVPHTSACVCEQCWPGTCARVDGCLAAMGTLGKRRMRWQTNKKR